MIADQIGLHSVLLPINHNFDKFQIYKALFFKSKYKKFQGFFAGGEKKSHLSTRVKARTVQFTEIRAVDSQSDLRILLLL